MGFRERGPANTLIPDFQPPDCETIRFCSLKPPSRFLVLGCSERPKEHPP